MNIEPELVDKHSRMKLVINPGSFDSWKYLFKLFFWKMNIEPELVDKYSCMKLVMNSDFFEVWKYWIQIIKKMR